MPVRPTTIARSIAIGNPTDGERAARVVCESGGWGAAVSDEALVRGIQILAEHAGIFTETAGGVTMAGALSLARVGRLTSSDEVVLYITGNGQKTIEAVESQVEELGPINTDLDELVEAATALSA